MNKGWNVLSWILIVVAQVAIGYGLVFLGKGLYDQQQVVTIAQFLVIPTGIWLCYAVGIYAIGMLGLVLKKVTPLVPGIRLMTTMTLAVVPMLMLIFNAVSVGPQNQQQFQGVVIARMVPYYTQLSAAFALFGFYITIWWHKAEPQTGKVAGKATTVSTKKK